MAARPVAGGSSFADLTPKKIQRFKANFALTRWIFFMTRSAKVEQLWAAPPLYRIVVLLYCTSYLTKAVPPGAPARRLARVHTAESFLKHRRGTSIPCGFISLYKIARARRARAANGQVMQLAN
jgi:hypothetical protein